MGLFDSLTTAHKKKIRETTFRVLERYRILSLTPRRESQITANYSSEPKSKTNITTDQTAKVAVFNADLEREQQRFAEMIETAVQRLPQKERLIIQKRYLDQESPYKTDFQIYSFEFDPPVSHMTYRRIRDNALLMVGIAMQLDFGPEVNKHVYGALLGGGGM